MTWNLPAEVAMPCVDNERDSPMTSSGKFGVTQPGMWQGASKTMVRKPFADEPRLVVTEEWRRRLRAWLDEERGRQAQLAKALGVDTSALSWLHSGRTHKSELVLPVCRITGIDPPDVEIDAEMKDDLARLRVVNPQAYEQLKKLARTFLNSK